MNKTLNHIHEEKHTWILRINKFNERQKCYHAISGTRKVEISPKGKFIIQTHEQDIKEDENISVIFSNKYKDKLEEIKNELNAINLETWEIELKNFKLNKSILSGNNINQKSFLNHYSLVAKIKDKGERESVSIGLGQVNDYNLQTKIVISKIKEIVKNNRQREKIKIEENLPLIIERGESSAFFHELFGHSLEADYVLKNLSPFKRSTLGKKICNEQVNIDNYIEKDNFFENILFDDQGNPLQRVNFIENGILKNFMSENFTSQALKIKNNCHGRSSSFYNLVEPRIFNFFVHKGNDKEEDILKSVKKGILAKHLSKGAVNFISGTFSCEINNAFLIENGKQSYPLGKLKITCELKNALKSISMLGDTTSFDRGISFCIKNGQKLLIRCSSPMIRVDKFKVEN